MSGLNRRLPVLRTDDPRLNAWAAQLVAELERFLYEVNNPINRENQAYSVSVQPDSRDLRGASTVAQVKDVLTTFMQDMEQSGKLITGQD